MPIDPGKALEWLASDGRKGTLSISRSAVPKLSLTKGPYAVDPDRKVAEWKDHEEKSKDKSKHKHKSKSKDKVKPEKSKSASSAKDPPPSVQANPLGGTAELLAAFAKLNAVAEQQRLGNMSAGGSSRRVLQAGSNDAPDVGALPAPAPAPAAPAPVAPAPTAPAPTAPAAAADTDNPLGLTAEQDAELIRLKTENENWKDIAMALGKEGKDIGHIKNRFNMIKPADWRPNIQGKKGNKEKNKGQKQEAKQEAKKEEKKEEKEGDGLLGMGLFGDDDADESADAKTDGDTAAPVAAAATGAAGVTTCANAEVGNTNINNNNGGPWTGFNVPGGNHPAHNSWAGASAANGYWNTGGAPGYGWGYNKNNNQADSDWGASDWSNSTQRQASGSKKAASHSGKAAGWGCGWGDLHGGGEDNRSVSTAPSYRDMYPDEVFSLEDIVLISRLLKRDDAQVFFRLACAFRDKTGRHIDEEVFRQKLMGEAKGKKESKRGSKKASGWSEI